MRAPEVWLASPTGKSWLPQVSSVLFAGTSDGWLYGGNTVWATHNGGASWRQTTLPGTVQTMAVTPHAVYAVIQRFGTGQLYSSPLTWNAWTRVSPHTWWYGPMTGTVLAVSGNSVWFAGGTTLWATADGVHWARYGLRTPGTYNGHQYTLTGISAANPRIVTFLWAAPTGMFRTGMKVQVSFNGGRSGWQTLATPPSVGNVAGFAMTPGGYGVISIAVVTPGVNYLYRSADLGQHWTAVALPRTGGGVMVNSLQFMNPTTGCLVIGAPVATMLWTRDGGQTWYPVRI